MRFIIDNTDYALWVPSKLKGVPTLVLAVLVILYSVLCAS